MSRVARWFTLLLVVACNPPSALTTTQPLPPVATSGSSTITTEAVQTSANPFPASGGVTINPAEWDAFMITVTPEGEAQPELLWGGALNWPMSEVPAAVAGAHPLVVLADEVLRRDGLGTSLWSLQGLSTEPRLMYRAPAGELLRLLGVTSSDELPKLWP